MSTDRDVDRGVGRDMDRDMGRADAGGHTPSRSPFLGDRVRGAVESRAGRYQVGMIPSG
ncbi:hypothetical protein P3L51_12240 [Streptomyces sp. PSRA5]|uniref:hypothetical protein n=1 Tax=Streptomyces panacea TaxID=3035064 RepID=UPI00339C4B5F